MGASFDIHLVRHGQSTWNAVRRIQGQTAHVPLAALGEQLARRAASQLADCGARAVFSSDLRRVLQTALPIAERLGVAVTQEPDLRERSLGELEGRSSDQVWSATCDGWGDARWRPPGGESIRYMCTRVARFRFLDRLRTSPDGAPAVVVTHGDTARSHSACCTASLPTPCPAPLANGEVITVRVPLPEPRRMSSDDGRFTADRPLVITHADGKVTGVRLSCQHLPARHVVIAAGTGTAQLLSGIGSPQVRLLRSRLDMMIHLPGAQLRRGLIFAAPDRPVIMPALGGGALVSFFGGLQPEITGRRAFPVDLGKAAALLDETLRTLAQGTAASDGAVAYVAGKTDYIGTQHAENGMINPGYHVIDHERTEHLHGLHTVITGKMTLAFHASKAVADSILGTTLPLVIDSAPAPHPPERMLAVEPWAAPARQ